LPRIDTIRVRIETGASGADLPPRIRFNGFELPLVAKSGGVQPQQVFEGEFGLRSMAHSCSLLGPKSAPWDIRALRVTYDYGAVQPQDDWTFGARTLKAGEEWNLLEKPPETFEV
jgi:hypothetical protein